MVDTIAGDKNIFLQVKQIHNSDMHHQSYVYFGLLVIVNVLSQVLPNPLGVSYLKNIAKDPQEIKSL